MAATTPAVSSVGGSASSGGVILSAAERKKKEKEKLKLVKKQQRKKKNKKSNGSSRAKKETTQQDVETAAEDRVEIEYVIANPLEELDPSVPGYEEFSKIFQHFTVDDDNEEAAGAAESKPDERMPEDEEQPKPRSNKQRKKEKRLSIAVLKSVVRRPDLVEAWDVTAANPNLLVYLKGYRNTVPVPRHWNQKRKYLQGKRGIEKPPFQLPDFIAATGISKIRAGISDDNKSLKTKQRERMQPKLGKMDIDYHVLHDAFFRYQTKPKLTIHGDLYYEGKEFEITLKEKKPGQLSEDLKRALGMPEGAPPPWLINMQRFGPPPCYPNLKIPGLNAPIPEGARYGYHPGGWGKPPVDEFGRPLYGDVFGTAPPPAPPEISQPIERKHWGELEEEEEEEEVEEEMEEQEEEEEPHPSGFATPSGMETPSGLETPESIELRKSKSSSAPPPPDSEDDTGKQLYQVIKERESAVGKALYGSSHIYDMPVKKELKGNAVNLIRSQASEKIDIALQPEDVERLEEGGEEVLSEKYESALKDKYNKPREDVSDIIAEHSKKKRKKDQKSDQKPKKYKDFKF